MLCHELWALLRDHVSLAREHDLARVGEQRGLRLLVVGAPGMRVEIRVTAIVGQDERSVVPSGTPARS